MVFTSQIFLFYFLPLTLAAYYLCPLRGRNVLLTIASYVFYGWWSPWFVALMFGSTAVDYQLGRALTAPGRSVQQRKLLVAFSVVVNLALLGFFKYAVFAQENLNRVLAELGRPGFAVWQVVLPVGISFYTFQSMSYCIDLYRGDARPARSFVDFAAYVALFPQLVAGPIVRWRDLDEQLRERPQRGELFATGVVGFALGFAKKILIANPAGELTDLAFGSSALTAGVAWLGIVAYAFQIYFDFSGYSDIAIGLGQMLGFRFPINFASPYRSESITEFWRRWHISLSTWLRDYLYVPLGGNRRGDARTYANLALTMLLGGLWHGAQWTFVAWGLFHGLLLATERALGKRPPYAALPRSLRVALTFVLVLLGWVLFRAADLESAGRYYAALVRGAGDPVAAAVTAARAYQPYYWAVLAIAAWCTWRGVETRVLVERAVARPAIAWGAFGALLLAVVAMYAQAENPFLYFQF